MYTQDKGKAFKVITFIKEEDIVQIEEEEELEVVPFKIDSVDSDQDGIADAYEVWELNSDPADADSDKDGFSDGYEVFLLGTSPAIFTEDRDSDQDGLSDLEEYKLGTNPYLADTDFDGSIDSKDQNPLKSEVNKQSNVKYTTAVHKGLYDRVEEVRNEDNSVTTYVLNLYNDCIKQIIEDGHTTSYYFNNDMKQVAVIEEEKGQYSSTVYTYENGSIVYLVNNGLAYSFDFDANENVSAISVGGRKLLAYMFHELDSEQNSSLSTMQNGSDDIYRMEYNADGMLSKVYINEVLTYEYSYYENQMVKSEKDYSNNVTFTYLYDDEGNKKEISCSNGFSITFESSQEDTDIESDSFKKTMRTSYRDGKVERVLGVVIEEDSAVNVKTRTTTMINGDMLQYSENSNIDTVTTSIMNGSGEAIFNQTVAELDAYKCELRTNQGDIYQYQYDKQGNIVSIEKNGQKYLSYLYDGMSQLVQENNAETGVSIGYTYDNAGNITSKSKYSYSETAVTSKPVEVATYSYDDESWGSLLTAYNGDSITYDNYGNPLVYRDDFTFDWKNGGKLSNVQTGKNNVSYQYGSEGLRTRKIVNGIQTEYTHEGDKVIKQESEGSCIWFLYDGNDEIAGFEHNGVTYYYEKDVLGDVVAILDAEGNNVAGYSYDAWGNIQEMTGDQELAKLNPIRYRSYYYDEETGFYYLNHRYYDSVIGRFISADDVSMILYELDKSNNYNLYSYALNNPLKYKDESGRSVWMYKPKNFGKSKMTRASRNYAHNKKNDKTNGKLVYGQGNKSVKNMKYGWKKLDYNGCEIIAVYNALKLQGYKGVNLPDIIAEFELNNMAWLRGMLGTKPSDLSKYFIAHKIGVNSYERLKDFKNATKVNSVYIVSFWNDSIPFDGIHTITVKDTRIGGRRKYVAYNRYNSATSTVSYNSIEDVLEEGTFICAYSIAKR